MNFLFAAASQILLNGRLTKARSRPQASMGSKWSRADAIEQEGSDGEMVVDNDGEQKEDFILIDDENASRDSPARGASSKSPGGSRSPVAAGKCKPPAPAAEQRRTRAQASGGKARVACSSPGESKSPRRGGSAAGEAVGARAQDLPPPAVIKGAAKRKTPVVQAAKVKAPAVQAAKVPVKEGEIVEIDRCSFRAGKVNPHTPRPGFLDLAQCC